MEEFVGMVDIIVECFLKGDIVMNFGLKFFVLVSKNVNVFLMGDFKGVVECDDV